MLIWLHTCRVNDPEWKKNGDFTFSAKRYSKPEIIGDVHCGAEGAPVVLSLQRTLIRTGPYMVRAAKGRKIEFNLELPTGAKVVDYRLQTVSVAAGPVPVTNLQ